MKYTLARYLFGVAAIGFGVSTLVFHNFVGWDVIKGLGDSTYQIIVTDIVGAVEVLGGLALVLLRTTSAGALVLAVVYGFFALLGVPFIVAHPLVYNGYGNFFEQLSLATGPAILYASSGTIDASRMSRLAQVAYYAFGVCVTSFALEQLVYLSATAGFVPKWVPPGQMFWAIATTVAFFAAALALLTGFRARLASQLNAAMIVGFGLLVWVPALSANPHSYDSWSETIETFAIAACAWIVTVYIRQREQFMRA